MFGSRAEYFVYNSCKLLCLVFVWVRYGFVVVVVVDDVVVVVVVVVVVGGGGGGGFLKNISKC